VAVLGMPSFASAVPILVGESDNPGAAMTTTGDVIPLKKAARSDSSSQSLLQQVGDMFDSSKASLRALATANETNESSDEIKDIAVVEWDVIAQSSRYTNDAGVDELREMSAIMTLLNTHLSDPAFISLLPKELKQVIKSLVHELGLADEAIVQIESFVATATATDHVPSSLYNQSAQRHLANKGDDAVDENGGPTNQDRFSSDEHPSSRRARNPHRDKTRYIMDDLIGHGHYARSHWNTETDQSRRHGRRTNSNGNDAQCDKPFKEQKLESCLRLAKCGKGYSSEYLVLIFVEDFMNVQITNAHFYSPRQIFSI